MKDALKAFAETNPPKMESLSADVEHTAWGLHLIEAELEENLAGIKLALKKDETITAAELLEERRELRNSWLTDTFLLNDLMEQFSVLLRENILPV